MDGEDRLALGALNLLFTIVFVFLISILFITICTTVVCDQNDKITSVGGCSDYGECGVMLSNGTTKKRYFPVIGQSVCIKQHRVWGW
jgi:hypothetical protein